MLKNIKDSMNSGFSYKNFEKQVKVFQMRNLQLKKHQILIMMRIENFVIHMREIKIPLFQLEVLLTFQKDE
jgi:hypothetical protein